MADLGVGSAVTASPGPHPEITGLCVVLLGMGGVSCAALRRSGLGVCLVIDCDSFWSWREWQGRADWSRTFWIELKPTVGDDYPAVLRQMKANGSSVLFVGEYRGQGATQEQFIKTMAMAGIRVVFARDVEEAGR